MSVARAVRVLTVIICLCLSTTLVAQDAGDTVVKQGTIKEDLYLAGGTVNVVANVEGDVIAVGGQVTIDNQVSGDVIAAGGNVTVRARVGDDVRLAGGNVTISGAVGDEALAAGAYVLLAPAATVRGRAWFVGHTVSVAGKIGKGLKAAGNRVVIAGEVAGDVELYADTIEIQPGAVIGGNLRYHSRNDAQIAGGAKIGGKVLREPLPVDGTEPTGIAGRIARGVFYIGLVLAGVVLYLLFPVATVGAARTIADSPWKSLGLGFAFLAAAPLVIALLFATVFGVWLALVALALYLLALFFGFLTGVIYLGEAGLELFGRRAETIMVWHVFAIIIAFLVLWVARFVPVLGGVVMFALMLFGLGALVLYLSRRYVSAA
jgi:cytoskeletal protein CcmA (bactofilin family)